MSLFVAAALLTEPAAGLLTIANRLPNGWESLQSRSARTGTEPKDVWSSPFPHVRVNPARRLVEFDGVVAWDFHNPDTPRTELELLVCLPLRDKEHESLVLSKASGAHVHAALLLIGLEPGKPGRFDFTGPVSEGVKRHPPVGPEVSVRFAFERNGQVVEADALSWVVDLTTGKPPATRLLFGGSSLGRRRDPEGEMVNIYNADELGCLVTLCTFGAETIGPELVVSHDSGLDAPRFVANNPVVPPADTVVKVRISPAKTDNHP